MYLSWSLLEFRDAYVAAGQLAWLEQAIMWGANYLLASELPGARFCGQIGDPGE